MCSQATGASSWVEKVGKLHKDHPTLTIAEDRIATEFASIAVFMGVSYIMDNHVEMRPVKQVLSYAIKPFIGVADGVMDELSALETDPETQARHEMDVDQRAYHYADMLFDTGISLAGSIYFQAKAQEFLDDRRGVGIKDTTDPSKGFLHNTFVDPYNRAVTFDKMASWGSAIALNSAFEPQNEAMQENIAGTLAGIMEKCGVPKEDIQERSTSMAKTAVNVGIPNMAGMCTAIMALSSAHGKQ